MPKLCGFEVRGHSIGGLETCIDLPELRLCFDIGRGPDFALARDTVLFTHAHMDHMGGIASHCATRALRRLPPPRYVVGHENIDALQALFQAWRGLDRSVLAHELVPLGPGEELWLTGSLCARPFRSPHRAPCQGYGLWSKRAKLKPEFLSLAPHELGALKREQVVITEPVEVPEIAFTGDTLIEVVEQEEVVRRARLLILECTFLDERVSVAESRAKGHVHLDEIAARAELFENEAILLTHFSPRYSSEEVRRLIREKLPPRLLERVTPFLPRHE